MLSPLNRINGRGFYDHAIPILCYHSTPRKDSFAMQMDCLAEAGWSVIGLREIIPWLQDEKSLRLPAVAITFDDCYQDQFANALPILTELGYPATFFAVGDWIQGRLDSEGFGEFPRKPLMGREELVELRRLGFEVGCHTRTHRSLVHLSPTEQRAEIGSGKGELEEILREEVRFFCYPYGRHTAETVAIVRECGYSAGVCTRVGAVQQGDDFFTLKRVCIPDLPTREEFRAQLTWIPQVAEMVHKVPHLDRVARAFWSAG